MDYIACCGRTSSFYLLRGRKDCLDCVPAWTIAWVNVFPDVLCFVFWFCDLMLWTGWTDSTISARGECLNLHANECSARSRGSATLLYFAILCAHCTRIYYETDTVRATWVACDVIEMPITLIPYFMKDEHYFYWLRSAYTTSAATIHNEDYSYSLRGTWNSLSDPVARWTAATTNTPIKRDRWIEISSKYGDMSAQSQYLLEALHWANWRETIPLISIALTNRRITDAPSRHGKKSVCEHNHDGEPRLILPS